MNEFVWTDLSTYYPAESLEFYKALFGWEIVNDNGYYIALVNSIPEVGIYKTPDFFKKIKMPHFWMNYIQVEDIEESVKRAKANGAKIEIDKVEFYDGFISLVRDPMGAGFTMYEGVNLKQDSNQCEGSVKSRELHTSKSREVLSFYSDTFGWKYSKVSDVEFTILSGTDKSLGRILELDNSVKGTYEYWVTEFYVDSISGSMSKLLELGGEVILDEGHRHLVSDLYREAFFYISEVN